ncbi:ABC transporter permease [Patescibacteria group bacterium]|nr:ABC transporter permease [Patescibacteria group bacterium]
MNLYSLIKEALIALTSNKARSSLTILGIVIGIGSVIAMVSIGQGAQGQIQASIQSIGSNLIRVSPGFQRGFSQVRSSRGSATTLTLKDAEAIAAQVPFVAAVAPEFSQRYQITKKSQNTNTQVIGTVDTYPEVRNIEIASGTFISERHVASFKKVAVLGPITRDDLFGEGLNPIGQTIKINRISFKIIGVTKSKGTSGFFNQDDIVFIPISTAQRFLAGSDYVTSISIKATEERAMSQVQESITQLLMVRHKIIDPQLVDFSVLNQADIVQAATQVTNTFTMLLASIAGISLLVGGIGIMNMMLTTVTERTREIGLRKAVGAKRRDIILQFLAEAIILTLLGGIIGIVLGISLALVISNFAGIETKISLSSIILASGVSAAIGLIFGYYPAHRAAQLNPIEALRYE